MKTNGVKIMMVLALAAAMALVACKQDGGDSGGSGGDDIPEMYKEFYNYPTGKADGSGTLKVTNNVAQEVLVFSSTVDPNNYVCTIDANSSRTIKLEPNKFHTLVSVTKSAYEKYGIEAAQSSALAYYSDVQGYTVNVSPEDLVGGGTWIFDNYTKYWVEIQSSDKTKTFAVIQPEAQRVTIPIARDKAYDYIVIYKKELKYGDMIIAISDMSTPSQSNTAIANKADNYKFTTPLNGIEGKTLANDLKPSVYLVNQISINNDQKTIRAYRGDVQLSNMGGTNDDYVIVGGTSAMLAGFESNTTLANFNLRVSGMSGYQTCTDTTTQLKNGKVYKVIVSYKNNKIDWEVTEENAATYYEE